MVYRAMGRAGAAAAVALVLVGGALLGCSGDDTRKPWTVVDPGRTQVRIGFAGPLTGDDEDYGQGMKRAIELAIKEANNSEEVRAAGYEFVIMVEDCGNDSSRALAAAENLAGDKDVIGVVDHLEDECSLSAASVYQGAGVTMVSVASYPELTSQGLSVVNRIVTRSDAQGDTAARMLLEEFGLSQVAVVDDSTPYGIRLGDSFFEALTSRGGEVAFRESIPAQELDAEEFVARLEELAPQAIYYSGAHTQGALISKHISEAGLDILLTGCENILCEEYINLAGPENAEGDISTMLGLPLDRQARGQDFRASYLAEYGSPPENHDSYAYDAASLFIQAVLDVGPDREKIAAAVREMRFHGVTGVTQFDEHGDTLNQVVSVFRVTEGEWAELEESAD